MKAEPGTWTRRSFVQAGMAASAAAVTRRASAVALGPPSVYAMVASFRDASGGLLQSFRIDGAAWSLVDEVALPARAHLAMHPTQPVVYACHDVALWQHLPRGAVSAWRICPVDGTLTLSGTQPLSLAATRPRFAVVMADARSLVTGTASGIYNVLPLAADGSLQPVSAMRKELGRIVNDVAVTASPRHAVAHQDGTLLAIDDRLGVLSRFRVERGGLVPLYRSQLPAGARQIAISRCGRWAYVLHGADATISTHRIDVHGVRPAHHIFAATAGAASMELCQDGRSLLLADVTGLHHVSLCAKTGSLLRVSAQVDHAFHQVKLLPGGRQIVGIDAARGELLQLSLPFRAKGFGAPRSVARVAGCTGVVFYPERA